MPRLTKFGHTGFQIHNGDFKPKKLLKYSDFEFFDHYDERDDGTFTSFQISRLFNMST